MSQIADCRKSSVQKSMVVATVSKCGGRLGSMQKGAWEGMTKYPSLGGMEEKFSYECQGLGSESGTLTFRNEMGGVSPIWKDGESFEELVKIGKRHTLFQVLVVNFVFFRSPMAENQGICLNHGKHGEKEQRGGVGWGGGEGILPGVEGRE